MDKRRVSKYLSYLLRHDPGSIGLEMDAQGWVSINELIGKSKRFRLNLDLIKKIVETNDKQRFAISEDGKRIRANQGHSVDIELDLAPQDPPSVLFHGTADRFIDSIMETGLTKQKRHHVHLSESIKTASAVGRRYGKLVILEIDSQQMQKDGFEFFCSENNVWLVDHVPAKYLNRQ